jgi:hypothetical protein
MEKSTEVDVKESKNVNAGEGDSKPGTKPPKGLVWQFIGLNTHAPLNSETRRADKCSVRGDGIHNPPCCLAFPQQFDRGKD